MTSFLLSIKNIAKSGFREVSKKTLLKRLLICNNCKFWDSHGWGGLGKCNKCGCSGIKLKMSASKCPIFLWNEELT